MLQRCEANNQTSVRYQGFPIPDSTGTPATHDPSPFPPDGSHTPTLQIVIALSVGTTSIVPSHKRGKLSGLYTTAESLGRFTGPASFAVMYAWSVSSYAPAWVDYHFVFYLCAGVMAMATVLSWRTLTPEILMKPAECEEAPEVPSVTAAGDDKRNIGDSFVSSPRTTRREADLV